VSVQAAVESGRRLLQSSFLDSCRIKRPTKSGDGGGGVTTTYPLLKHGIPCRFGVPIDPLPNAQLGAIFSPPTAAILLPLGTDVKEGDHVENEKTGAVWLVIGNKTPESALAICTRINVREV
jgi:hypothetical protein